jgi:hypothetical protein
MVFTIVQHITLVFVLSFDKYSTLVLWLQFHYDVTQRSGYIIRVIQHVRLVLCYDLVRYNAVD